MLSPEPRNPAGGVICEVRFLNCGRSLVRRPIASSIRPASTWQGEAGPHSKRVAETPVLIYLFAAMSEFGEYDVLRFLPPERRCRFPKVRVVHSLLDRAANS